jgi:hypothetical protein
MRTTVVMLTTMACIAFFTDLGILSKPLSIYTLFTFVLVVVTHLVRHYLVTSKWLCVFKL